jgi:outer membrane protein OmpA-like peptidoglycan-associated protein
MTLSKTLSATAVLLAFAGSPAAAQMYPGQDVTVNPYAVPASPLVLYPGGVYTQRAGGVPGGTIHLHMPVHRRHIAKVVPKDTTIATATPTADGGVDIKLPPPNDTAAAAPPPDTSPAPATSAPASHHKHSKPVETATAAPATPPPAATPSAGELPMNLDGSDAPPPTPPAKSAKGPTRVASTEPAPAETVTPQAHADAEHANLTKSGAILFDSGATDPSPSQFDGVKLLAGNLNSALEAGATRVQLEAYGGAPGDKSSDARRLSLKRALAVRQLLIDDGVPSGRIDVRAMGGIDDKGPVDRVDVFVRAS